MKTIPLNKTNFQNFYASGFVSVILSSVAIEIFILVIAIFGGAK